ncbi:MAG: SWIM zinc finger family protein [Acutalibacteraceae bacterium]|nr:SWIM zinc finger family protein [Acutalibacteraceae bacterium]
MSLLTTASGKSVYRGYEYFLENKVLSCVQINDFEYEGTVKGTAQKPYSVHLNLKKPKTSTCDCPFANGLRICKHMVAVFFTVFPEEAENYKRQLEEYEAEEEQREQEFEDLCNRVIERVHSMPKNDLKQALLQLLFEGPEWQFERFINEYIEW